MKRSRIISIALAALVAVAVFAGSASAYCGPGFASKSQAIAYYHTPAGKKFLPSMKKKLISWHFMHADESVMAFLESARVKFVITPNGYTLTGNTSCSGSTYGPYNGLYGHSHRGVLAVVSVSHVKVGKSKKGKSSAPKVVKTSPEINLPQTDGSTDVYVDETIEVSTTHSQKYKECTTANPFMKDYCRNVVKGPKWHKCKTYLKHFTTKVRKVVRRFLRKIPAPKSEAPAPTTEGPKTGPVSAKQQCEQAGNRWVEDQQQCFVIVGNCSIIVVGSNNTITVNGDICPTTTTTPPPTDCGCHNPPPPVHTCKDTEKGTYPDCVPKTCEDYGNCKGHANLTKAAYLDGNFKSLSGGEFGFSVSVNGSQVATVTNAASGQSRDLGEFNAGDSVQVCESNTAGYTPDQGCVSHTMKSGETFTFSFTNRKTTPPPPPTCQSQGTCPKPGLSIGAMNDVQMGYTSDNYCVTAQLAAGRKGTLVLSTGFGHWGTGNASSLVFHVVGTQKVCALISNNQAYTAPTEAPSGDSDIPDGYDRITSTLTDDDYQTSTVKWTQFKILAPEPNAP